MAEIKIIGWLEVIAAILMVIWHCDLNLLAYMDMVKAAPKTDRGNRRMSQGAWMDGHVSVLGD